MKKLLYLYNDGHNAFPHIKGGAIFETYEDDDEGGEILRRRDDGNRDDTNIYANNVSLDYDDEVIGSVIYEPDGSRRVNYVMSPFTGEDSEIIPSHRFNDEGDDIQINLNREIAQQVQDERERELYGILGDEAVEFEEDDEDLVKELYGEYYDNISSFKQDVANATSVNELKQINSDLNGVLNHLKSILQKVYSEASKLPIKNASEWYKIVMSELDDYVKKAESNRKRAYKELGDSIVGLGKILVGKLVVGTEQDELEPEGKEIIDNFFKTTIEKQIDKQLKDMTTKKISEVELLSKSRKLAPTLYNLVKREIESKNIKADILFNKYIFNKLIDKGTYVMGANKTEDTVRGYISTQMLITLAQKVLDDKIGAIQYNRDKYLSDIQLNTETNAKVTDAANNIVNDVYNEMQTQYKSQLKNYKSLEYVMSMYENVQVEAAKKIQKINKERVRKEAPMVPIPKEADPSIVREEKPTKKEGLSKSQKKKLKKEKQLDTAVSRLKTMVPHASGPLLEDYLSKDGSNILNMITEDKSPIINNMDNKNIPNVDVDINGEVVSLRSASTLDAYNKDNVFEIKNYKLNSQSDDIPIQLSKLQGTPIFTPYYLSNGRLYNIEVDVYDINGVKHNKYIYPSNENGRELYMIYKLSDGLYKYKPMEGDDVKLKAVQATTKGGKQLYVYHGSSLQPTVDIYGNKSLVVPRSKLIKI